MCSRVALFFWGPDRHHLANEIELRLMNRLEKFFCRLPRIRSLTPKRIAGAPSSGFRSQISNLRFQIAVLMFVGIRLAFAQEVNTNAPSILSVSGVDTQIQLTFNLPVELAGATNAGNYSLSNLYGPVAILSARPGTDSQKIQIRTDRQLPFMQHWLTVNSVADALTGTNWIAPNSQGSYTNIAFTTGYLKSDYYLGLAGTTLAALTNSPTYPDHPNRTKYLAYSYWFDSTVGANYGNRMSGILVPPTTGAYTFLIYAPTLGLLSLSTNEDPAFKRAISTSVGQNYTPSAQIQLEAGHRYYFEALSKEGTSPSDYSELIWTTPDYTNSWSLIPIDSLGNYLTDPAATIRIARQPADAHVYDNRRATFQINATGTSIISTNLNYQWQKNGVDIPGATDATYITPLVYETNSGWSYRVLIYLPGAATFSQEAVLSVTRDLVPPTVVQAFNFGSTNVQLLFSEEVDLASANDVQNYSIPGGPAITAASLDFSGTVVTLTTEPLAYGSTYSLVINNVRDQAMIPNTIATNTTVSISVAPSFTQDVGSPPSPTVTTVVSNGLDIASLGRDIGGTKDQFNLNYQLCAGDFDICVRLAGLSLSDLWAKAGLMARETLDPGSRFAATLATPSMNGGSFEYRVATNATAAAYGSFPGNYPDTWLRLQRFGSYLTGYSSYDGHIWSSLGGVYFTNLPAVLYVGLATTSHSADQRVVAQFRDWQLVPPNAVQGRITAPHEPLGPSSRKTPISISEIMYKPAPRTDGNNVEFLELYNSNPWFHDISGYRIVGNNMTYTVPAGTIIPGGGFLVIAASPQSVQRVYGVTNVLGPYTGTLKNPDSVTLIDEHGAVLLTVPYSNVYPWPVAADGTGHSLVLAKASYGEEDPHAWDLSDVIGGSPGLADSFHPDPLRDVRINEILAHSEDPAVQDFVELYNHSDRTNDLSGCILTDDASVKRFTIPAGTLISPGGFVSFDRTQLGFGLSSAGETVFLIKNGGSRILDAVQYEGQGDRVSFGRWPDGAGTFYPLSSRTPGTNNSKVLIGDIVINELMYNPISGNDDDQYIELYNQGTNLVSLAGWQFVSGITFTFPTNAILAPEGYLVLARNRANLFAKYPNLNTANTLGDFSGRLSHNGERVALARPQTNNGTQTVYVVEDEVTYGVGGRWGQWSAKGGSSLELIDPRANHQLAANWADSDDTQKSTWTNIEVTGVLDNGRNFGSSIGYAQLGPLDAGECLVDNVEVVSATGVNYVRNSGFESGLADWSLQGCMVRSSIENTGFGGSGHSLHVRCSSRIFTGANACQVGLNGNGLGAGQTATLRFKARWLHGWPEVLLRLNGNWLEAVGAMPIPPNLGTPGARNSRSLNNPGPSIYEVTHTPTLPAYGEDAIVTARLQDPDGVQICVLNYRYDPDTSYTQVPMKDDGTGGDALAGDGIFSATIPGAYGIAAFFLSATDARGATTRFPQLVNDRAPVRECIVNFGEENPAGSFGVYHLWLTQTNLDLWSSLPNLSNEMIDGTFVQGNRVIYNMQARYVGSPYHQQYYSPQYSVCHFKWVFPDDDKFLGATSFNKLHAPGNGAGDDLSLQREQTAYTFMRALGVPWLNRRYVAVFVNGYRNTPLMEDAQCPDADMVKEYFPNDTDGFLYKLQPWFEFAPFASGNYLDFNNEAWCAIMPFFTTGHVKKTARYRYNFEVRRTPDSANNFTNLFSLIDAASSPGGANYAANIEALADMENWMRVFAANHAAGNWDSFGCPNAQNLYAYFGTQGTRCSLMMFDFNIVFGNSGSWGPGQNLFTLNTADNNLARIFTHPNFRRMYLRALDELVKGPLDVAKTGPLLDAKYNAFVANGLSPESPASIKSWLISAKSSIAAQIAPQTTVAFTVNASVAVNDDLATIAGTAPVGVETILVNGVEWPITWVGYAAWNIRVPLQPGTNVFSVVGLDGQGRPVSGASGICSAVFAGEIPSPQGQIVINEIMYQPKAPGGQYVELFNASTNFTFDLSGWQIAELGYTFPSGSLIQPNQFLVLATDRIAFAAAYGATVPVSGTFSSALTPDGQVLTLSRPAAGASEVVTQVRYESVAPWPAVAPQSGIALQLLDPTRDNWRVGNWAADAATPPFSPGANSLTRTNLSEFPPLWLNELQADNQTGITNRAGQHVPWVELFNPSSTAVSLDGLYLTDTYASLTNWALPTGTTIAPRGFKLVFLDNQTNLSTTTELHAGFTLSNASGGVALSRLDTNGVALMLDYLNYTNLGPDHAYGSYPDGQSFIRHSLATATPAGSNNNTGSSFTLTINEWMAGNTHTLKNPVTGKYDDWFELFNYGDTAINLAGFYLARSITNLSEFQIPAGYTIPAHGFLLVWADKVATNGTLDLHANFKLTKSGTSICLRSPGGTLVDYISFGPQTSDISMGRYPDGAADISILPAATPAAANATPNTPPTLLSPGTKFVYLGQTLTFAAQGLDGDLPRQLLTYTLDPGSPTNAAINPASGVFTWTPSARQTPSTNYYILRVTDNGLPPLSTTETFVVVVGSPPLLSAAGISEDQVTLAWSTYKNQAYQLQYQDDLATGSWLNLGPPFLGTGDIVSFTSLTDFKSSPHRFYRLTILP
jgi:hypothetical protein